MKFRLINEQPIRHRLENVIVSGEVKESDRKHYDTVLFKMYNVLYEVDITSLNVLFATPLNENAVVPTAEGLISWKNHYVELRITNDGDVEQNNELRNFYDISSLDMGPFCYDFVCLGRLPSENAIKIKVEDLRAFDEKNGEMQKVDQAGFKVTETENSLIIERTATSGFDQYEFGQVVKDKFFSIQRFYMSNTVEEGYRYQKLIIPRGTCIKTYIVFVKDSEGDWEQDYKSNYYELCY